MFELNMIEANDLAQYGLELFLLKVIHFGGIFLFSFLVLRSNSGGYHAKTRLRCFLTSMLITVFVLYISPLLESFLLEGLTIISSVLIYKNSPLVNENNPLYPEEYKMLHKRVKSVLIVIFLNLRILKLFKLVFVVKVVCIAVLLAFLFMVIEIIIKEKEAFKIEIK